ncbi:hypothetical protein BH09CHL1_BH09CHL1_31430 [soil metagenome]
MSRRPAVRAVVAIVMAIGLIVPALFSLRGAEANQQSTTTPTGVNLYYYRDGLLGVANRASTALPQDISIYDATLSVLLQGPLDDELAAGLKTELPNELLVESAVTVDDSGIATVNFSSQFTEGNQANLQVSDDMMGQRMAQIVFTLTQFSEITGVKFEVAGEAIDARDSDGATGSGAVDRSDYESITPAIFVETPGVWGRFESPMHLTGTANTFEASVNYRLTDVRGQLVVEGHFQATSGTGTRGTFDETIPFEVTRQGRATLVLFESSAKDGSEINVVAIPVDIRRPAADATATATPTKPATATATATKTATPVPTSSATAQPTIAPTGTAPATATIAPTETVAPTEVPNETATTTEEPTEVTSPTPTEEPNEVQSPTTNEKPTEIPTPTPTEAPTGSVALKLFSCDSATPVPDGGSPIGCDPYTGSVSLELDIAGSGDPLTLDDATRTTDPNSGAAVYTFSDLPLGVYRLSLNPGQGTSGIVIAQSGLVDENSDGSYDLTINGYNPNLSVNVDLLQP